MNPSQVYIIMETELKQQKSKKEKKKFLLLDYVFVNRYAQALSGFPRPILP